LPQQCLKRRPSEADRQWTFATINKTIRTLPLKPPAVFQPVRTKRILLRISPGNDSLTMLNIPTYSLYGETAAGGLEEQLHCESIAARSRLYDWEIGTHRHEGFLQILYVSHGGGRAHIDGRTYPIEAPCAIVVPAMAVHGFQFTKDTDGVVSTAVARHLQGMLASADGLWALFARPLVRTYRGEPQRARDLAGFVQSFFAEFASSQPWRVQAIDTLLALMLTTIGRSIASQAADATGTQQRKLRHLHRYRELIEHHYREQRPIAWYSQRVGITPTQLNRICREVLARSALQAINDRVLLEARRDLVYTSLGIKEIAASLGFTDAGYFSRFFTRHSGHTPMAYRRAARDELSSQGASRATPRADADAQAQDAR
jgi:AraC family transcriptional regulator, transcriptional activator of pobA